MAKTRMSLSSMASRGAAGAYRQVEEPRLAAVEGGTTKPLMEIAPADRRICWNLVAGGK
jgi:hypothetical protein